MKPYIYLISLLNSDVYPNPAPTLPVPLHSTIYLGLGVQIWI